MVCRFQSQIPNFRSKALHCHWEIQDGLRHGFGTYYKDGSQRRGTASVVIRLLKCLSVMLEIALVGLPSVLDAFLRNPVKKVPSFFQHGRINQRLLFPVFEGLFEHLLLIFWRFVISWLIWFRRRMMETSSLISSVEQNCTPKCLAK